MEKLTLISKILIAYDGTECSNRAMDVGLDLAEKYSASVLILNVLELPVYGTPEDPFAISAGMNGLIKELRKSHEAMLANAADKAARQKPNLKMTTQLNEGNPPSTIVSIATDGEIDIIVMGHGGGDGRFRELFLGGTSERVAHLAHCSVLIVK